MSFYKKNDCAVYIVSEAQNSIKRREKMILGLRESYAKMVLVTQTGTMVNDKNIVVGAYPNPFGLLRILGFHKFKKKLEKYIYFPSQTILYVRPAIKKLKKMIRRDIKDGKKVTLITSVPPHGISLIGLSLKKYFSKIHWIVDWRDLWSYDEYYFNRTPKLYKRKLLKLEKKIMENCNINITTNQNAKKVLENHYNVSPNRVISISHSFNRTDLSGFDQLENKSDHKGDGQIHIGFLGYLFKLPKVPGYKVVEAIENVNKSGITIKLHIFGDKTDKAKKVAELSKDGQVILHPPTSHEESLRKISDCDFLLLALSDLPNCHVIIHGKLPHYLLLKRPIIAMVPNKSAVADIIKETGSGYVISTNSDWGYELKKILSNYTEGLNLPIRNENEIEKYSWANISKEWLNII